MSRFRLIEYITFTFRHLNCHGKWLGRVNLCCRKFAVITVGTFRAFSTERARLGNFRGFGTERAKLRNLRGCGTESARLGTLNQNFWNFHSKWAPTCSEVFFLKFWTKIQKSSYLLWFWKKNNSDPQLHLIFKPIRKFFCTFLPI